MQLHITWIVNFLIDFTDGNVTLQASSQECFLFLGSNKCSHAGTSFFVFAFCIQSLVSSEFYQKKLRVLYILRSQPIEVRHRPGDYRSIL